FQFAVNDDIDGLRRHTLVIDRVGAEERFAVEFRLERVVGDADHVRKNARFQAGGVCTGRACSGAHLGAVGFDVGDEKAGEDVGGHVSTDEQGPVVVFGRNDRSIAQLLEAFQVVDSAFAEGCGGLQLFRGGRDGAV